MLAKKALVSGLIAAATLGAALPSSAAGFSVFFGTTPARHDSYYDRGHHYQSSRFDRDGDGIPNHRDRTPDGAGPRWDRDNDGIANRFDRTPNGEVRIARRADRDGDGVPNRFDNYPNNPRWR